MNVVVKFGKRTTNIFRDELQFVMLYKFVSNTELALRGPKAIALLRVSSRLDAELGNSFSAPYVFQEADSKNKA